MITYFTSFLNTPYPDINLYTKNNTYIENNILIKEIDKFTEKTVTLSGTIESSI